MSEMWNSVAPSWEENAETVDEQLAPATDLLLDAVGIGEGDAVLELACGPGGAGLAAAGRVGPQGTVVLSDAAAEMVAAAARRAAPYPWVTTAVFDQDAIAAQAGHFDAVISRHGLMFSEDPAATVREATRVLRSGGRYAAMTWGPREQNPWLGLVLDAVGEQFGVPFPPPGVRGPFALSDPALLAGTLEDGGLTAVRIEPCSTPMRSASLEAWWERVPKLAGPLAIALANMEPDVREAIAERALAAAARAARRDGDRVELAGSVLIASGEAPRD